MQFGRTLSVLLVYAILACPALCSTDSTCSSCLDACGDSSPESHHPERDCSDHPCFCHALQSADQGATRIAGATQALTLPATMDCTIGAISAGLEVVGLTPALPDFHAAERLQFISLPLLI